MEKEMEEDKNVKEKEYKIVIQEQEGVGGTQDVFVGINGKGYLIKRGMEVVVPAAVLANLKDSIYTNYIKDLEKGIDTEKQVPRFSVTVEGEAKPSDKIINKRKVKGFDT